ncbi:MAG TPA: histidine phosphatase family protein [Nevskiaceae bacterium]|nr:histidine phosphatase family protein [Nevskiaceae bacterium]
MGSLLLIRHGQASFGKADYDALSEIGFRQSQVLGASLAQRQIRPALAFSGGMRRHQETAETCLAALGRTDLSLEIDPGFREYDHEEVLARYQPRYADRAALAADMRREPEPRRAFQALFRQAVARWMSGEHDADYRETWPQFAQRCTAAAERAAARLGSGQTGLVFTSGGCISAVVQALLGLPDPGVAQLNWTLANAGITKVLVGQQGLRLSSLNEHSAFEGEHAALLSYR